MNLDILKLEQSLKAQLPSLKEEVMSFLRSEEFLPFQDIYELMSAINLNLPMAELEALLSDSDRFYYLRELVGFRFKIKEGNPDTPQEGGLEILKERNRLMERLLAKPLENELVNFDCFESAVKPKDKVTIFLARRRDLLNVKGWRHYFIELYKLHFPRYTPRAKEGFYQFLIELKGGYFGFELDFRNLDDQLRRGMLMLPRTNHVIWIDKPFGENKQVLGVLDFVTNSVVPSAEDYLISNKVQYINGMIQMKSFVQQTPKGDKVLLHGDEIFGQKVIKCAYYYSEWSSRFYNYHLDFIRRGVEEVIK